MRLRTVGLVVAVLAGAFVAVNVVLTLLSLLAGLVVLLVTAVTLAVLVFALIGSYRVYTWARRPDPDADVAAEPDAPKTTADRLERLRERYVAGELTEAEYERRLEVLLDAESLGVLDDRDWGRDDERDPALSGRY